MSKINEGEKRVHRVAMSMRAGPKDLKRALAKVKRRRMKAQSKQLSKNKATVDEARGLPRKDNDGTIHRRLRSGEYSGIHHNKEQTITSKSEPSKYNNAITKSNIKDQERARRRRHELSFLGQGNKAKKRANKLKNKTAVDEARVLPRTNSYPQSNGEELRMSFRRKKSGERTGKHRKKGDVKVGDADVGNMIKDRIKYGRTKSDAVKSGMYGQYPLGKGNKAKKRAAKLKESINYRIARIIVEAYLEEGLSGASKEFRKVKRARQQAFKLAMASKDPRNKNWYERERLERKTHELYPLIPRSAKRDAERAEKRKGK
jgi:hypothetical protein